MSRTRSASVVFTKSALAERVRDVDIVSLAERRETGEGPHIPSIPHQVSSGCRGFSETA
jgi:hypothetical protein